jgi:2-methylcitrate dehydratase PrpD
VHVAVDPEFERRYAGPGRPFPVAIEVTLKNGTHYSAAQDYFSGHPKMPLTHEQLVEKFRHLTSRQMSADAQSRLIATVDLLERHGIGDLTKQLPRSRG